MTPSKTASTRLLRAELWPPRMPPERQVRLAAGALVLAGVMLGLHVHPLFLVLPAAVGLVLLWSGVTEACGLGLLLARHRPAPVPAETPQVS